jgi:hypothetical protein
MVWWWVIFHGSVSWMIFIISAKFNAFIERIIWTCKSQLQIPNIINPYQVQYPKRTSLSFNLGKTFFSFLTQCLTCLIITQCLIGIIIIITQCLACIIDNNTVPYWYNNNNSVPYWYYNNTVADWYNKSTVPYWYNNNTVPYWHNNNTVPYWYNNTTVPYWYNNYNNTVPFLYNINFKHSVLLVL